MFLPKDSTLCIQIKNDFPDKWAQAKIFVFIFYHFDLNLKPVILRFVLKTQQYQQKIH